MVRNLDEGCVLIGIYPIVLTPSVYVTTTYRIHRIHMDAFLK